MANRTHRILVVHVSRIGDTLLCTPALRAIAHQYPNSEITVLAHPNRIEVLQHLPYVHRYIAATKKTVWWRGRLRLHQFDIAFVFGSDASLIKYALRASKKVIAYNQDDETLNKKLYICGDPIKLAPSHATDVYLNLVQLLGVKAHGRRLELCLTPAEINQAARLLSLQLQLNEPKPLIGLQVASFPTKAYRDWPLEYFHQLTQRLLSHWPDAYFLILGGPNEREQAASLSAKIGSRSWPLTGTLTLRQTAAIMSQLDLYVGVDTGPTHMMSTFDIPMVALYHCRSPSCFYGPIGHPHAALIDHPLAQNSLCDTTSPMSQISIETVFHAALKVLDLQAPIESHAQHS